MSAVSAQSRIAARFLREAVDQLLIATPLERIPDVEPFCARVWEIADMLDPEPTATAQGDALLGQTVGAFPNVARLDRAMGVRNQSVAERRLK